MPFPQRDDPSSSDSRVAGREYIADSAPRRKTPVRRIRSSTRLRFAYFAFASLWGFLAGVGSLLAATSLVGKTPRLGVSLVTTLVPGAALAVLGGIVAAAAYREARRRLR